MEVSCTRYRRDFGRNGPSPGRRGKTAEPGSTDSRGRCVRLGSPGRSPAGLRPLRGLHPAGALRVTAKPAGSARPAWLRPVLTAQPNAPRSRASVDPGLEAGQVLGDLPGTDLLVVAKPLVALDPDVVVDVVLVTATAERGTQDIVLFEVADSFEEIGG